ncbi:hypothetical protein CQA49_05205 [Helicobacter sp. MIT 00-7814]|uniref:hypothetical protein n=1 Tax=unclassified Helicobacter TaxID=2593540 RepID=UPI000E1FA170|nr:MULTISPECIES: hypothetical protein [unclassified Helicobacter]RDU54396.1 hypothetical protein CQA37_05695 [Helicobacter sp. MIT 99-10781]RDU54473.1 hypothetical protein CQA49_05205 [Helicobacter sp. MIT 00-7814]
MYRLICILIFCLNAPAFADKFDSKTTNTILQFLSLHVGPSTDFGLPHANIDTKTGINVGASIGINYLLYLEDPPSCVDFDARLRYLYSHTFADTHSIGAAIYIHPFQNYEMPFILGNREDYEQQPYFSLIFGGGALFSKIDNHRFNGGYIEAGIGLLKLYPLVNIDILYRASFYGERWAERVQMAGADSTMHGIHVVFNISPAVFMLWH